MKTALNATRLAITAFVVPYIFAFNPNMLFEFPDRMGTAVKILESVLIVVTSLIGLFGIAAALNGFLYRSINPLFRVLMVAGGLCMMVPDHVTDVIGLVVVGCIVVFQRMRAKKTALS